MKNKIIFLDIDGVLNGYGWLSYMIWKLTRIIGLEKWYKSHRRNPCGIHEEKVRRLAKIVHKTNAKIVMSSSWRHRFWNIPYEDKMGDLKILTDLFNKYDIEVIDITPRCYRGQRDIEIVTWLSYHEDQVSEFVILDDEPNMLKYFKGNHRFICTSSVSSNEIIKGYWYESAGIKNKHVKKAIKILNGKYEKRGDVIE